MDRTYRVLNFSVKESVRVSVAHEATQGTPFEIAFSGYEHITIRTDIETAIILWQSLTSAMTRLGVKRTYSFDDLVRGTQLPTETVAQIWNSTIDAIQKAQEEIGINYMWSEDHVNIKDVNERIRYGREDALQQMRVLI